MSATVTVEPQDASFRMREGSLEKLQEIHGISQGDEKLQYNAIRISKDAKVMGKLKADMSNLLTALEGVLDKHFGELCPEALEAMQLNHDAAFAALVDAHSALGAQNRGVMKLKGFELPDDKAPKAAGEDTAIAGEDL